MQAPPESFAFGWNPTGDWGPFTIYTSKRRRPVFFLKAPPKEPPTDRQTYRRDAFRLVARLWAKVSAAQKRLWEQASIDAHLSVTGYNLYVYYQLTKDRNTIRTIEQQTNLVLLP